MIILYIDKEFVLYCEIITTYKNINFVIMRNFQGNVIRLIFSILMYRTNYVAIAEPGKNYKCTWIASWCSDFSEQRLA